MSCVRPNTPRSDPKAVSELAEPLRPRIAQAIKDAPTGGLVLVSGYRDPGRQWDLRHERCRGRECDRACKGYPITAIPGASKHQTRQAADMGGRDLNWLISNRARYGLGLTVRSENWHFEASGIDSRTGRRIGDPTVKIGSAAGNKPQRPNILKKGSRGDFVRWYQALLGIIAQSNPNVVSPGKADGIYGKQTTKSARSFEIEWNKFLAAFNPSAKRLQVDGILTVHTMNAIEWTVRAAR